VIESHFGESSPWSIGVEEEIMILDPGTFEQAPAVEGLLEELTGTDLPGEVTTELHASIVELKTGICRSPQEALEQLSTLRSAVARAARSRGLVLAASGSHPLSLPAELEIVQRPRYQEFVAYAGVSARRQGVSGLHIHVGMPTADACFHALEAVLPWLPVVAALAANSPYLAGEETGHLSNRLATLAELPRSGAPPAFRSYEEWEAFVERFARSGIPLTGDYTSFWWDARPHPRLGTLEVRMPDQQTSLARTAAFTALVQALCLTVLGGARPPYDPGGRGVYQQNRWAALHSGPDARLIRPGGEGSASAAELGRELYELVREGAGELGTSDVLAPLETCECEGERQLRVGRARGLTAVCADLVERSLP